MAKEVTNHFNSLTPSEVAELLKSLRKARYSAQRDAEDFLSICFALENFGMRIRGEKKSGLGSYTENFEKFFDAELPMIPRLKGLMVSVTNARNDAAHQGIFARSVSSKAVYLSGSIEGVLVRKLELFEHIMTDSPVCASDSMSIGDIRRVMLENSFSFLYFVHKENYYFISDAEVAVLWNRGWSENPNDNRKEDKARGDFLYFKSLNDLIELGCYTPRLKAKFVDKSMPISSEKISKQIPLLVEDKTKRKRKYRHIVGIVTAFDWL